jgi:hypothetical protein
MGLTETAADKQITHALTAYGAIRLRGVFALLSVVAHFTRSGIHRCISAYHRRAVGVT